jgi:DNA processing protein
MNKQNLGKSAIIDGSALPELLKQIPDPPKTLYTCGNIDVANLKDTKYLCVVGSRRYTNYGKEVCTSLIKSLAGMPVVIVSGLALGIDGIAHQAAIDAGLKTIAVPGSGLHPDTLYPRSHYDLAEEIVKNGGLLLSEYPPETRASPWTFPMRNRILAGLSHAVLIIEAEEDSGTLITARLALDYDRDIGAIPGSVLSESCRGTNNLIKRGATPITCPQDLHELLGLNTSNEEYSSRKLHQNPYAECSEEELIIAEELYNPKTREELSKCVNVPHAKLQVTLSMLDIRGIIREAYGTVALRYPPPSAILRKNRKESSEENKNGDQKNSDN